MHVVWPTHKHKARSRHTHKIAKKKQARKQRRLHKDGKRGVINADRSQI